MCEIVARMVSMCLRLPAHKRASEGYILKLLHYSSSSRKLASSGRYACLALLVMSVMGCDPEAEGDRDAAVSKLGGGQAKDTQAWLLYGVADDGTPITTRIERSKAPPVNVRKSEDLSFSIEESDGTTVRTGHALVSARKRARFGAVDGPVSGHHWDDEELPMAWIPLGDAPAGSTVSLTSASAEASILVPPTTAFSSHNLEEIDVNGPPESKINIVIIGDGYTANEASKFRSDSDAIAEFLFANRPYGEYRVLFNVYRFVTESPESGADHPDLGIDVLNLFNSRFNCGGIPRALCADSSRVLNIVFSHLPEVDQVLLVVNDERYGGTGGQLATTSTHETSPYIAVHEFGHSLARLADEYEDAAANQEVIAPEDNVSLSSERDEIKWKHWIEESTGLPTFEQQATSDVEPIGAYEGARYRSSDIFRPAPSCMMRVSESDLCSVCVEATVKVFHAMSTLILSAEPPATEPIHIATRTAPIEFQMELPDLPNLDVRWLVDGEEIGSGQSLTLDPTAVRADAKVLQLRVTHTTELVRSDPAGYLTEEIEWDLTDGVQEEEDDEEGGCGCQHSPSPSSGMLFGLLLLYLMGRRRVMGWMSCSNNS